MSERNSFLARFGDEDHIHKALDSGDKIEREVLTNPSLTKDHILKILDPTKIHWSVRIHAAQHKKVDSECFDKLINDPHPDVRQGGVFNSNITKKTLKNTNTR